MVGKFRGRHRFRMFLVFSFYFGVVFISLPLFLRTFRINVPLEFFPIEIFGTIGAVVIAVSSLAFAAIYLGIFDPLFETSYNYIPNSRSTLDLIITKLEKIESAKSKEVVSNVSIDDEIKQSIINSLTETTSGALEKFIEGEVFKKESEQNEERNRYREIAQEFSHAISEYKGEISDWRRNANVNLLVGLVCAVAGIFLMWQILIWTNWTSSADGALHWNDVYRFAARLGLVVLIESVAFFFLKLYREDRALMRYLRNEVTNLEARSIALKASLTFANNEALSKILLALNSTERNFIVKKGDRVLSELTQDDNGNLLDELIKNVSKKVDKTNTDSPQSK